VSRRSQAKRARRNKRRAARNETWIPEAVHERLVEELDIAAELADFDARLTERGWRFSDDPNEDHGAIWFWPPSHIDEADPDEVVNATVVVLVPDDGGEIAHVILAGAQEDYQFDLDELFEHLDAIEAYRLGGPPPELPEFSD
jgi:hypothetical protein